MHKALFSNAERYLGSEPWRYTGTELIEILANSRLLRSLFVNVYGQWEWPTIIL